MEPFIGEIQLFPFGYTPPYWMICHGGLVPIAHNESLFSLIGTNYGGDGCCTFALPDLRGVSPVPGMEYYIALKGELPSQN